MLIIFSGLPGVGKSTLARALAHKLGAVYLRADTMEQAMRDYGLTGEQIGGMGYGVGCRIATENLRLGLTVVADMVNPWALTRDMWHQAARDADSTSTDIEVVCSDVEEHRRRVEGRSVDVHGLELPTWADVQSRDYHPWEGDVLRIDTAHLRIPEALALILSSERFDAVRRPVREPDAPR